MPMPANTVKPLHPEPAVPAVSAPALVKPISLTALRPPHGKEDSKSASPPMAALAQRSHVAEKKMAPRISELRSVLKGVLAKRDTKQLPQSPVSDIPKNDSLGGSLKQGETIKL